MDSVIPIYPKKYGQMDSVIPIYPKKYGQMDSVIPIYPNNVAIKLCWWGVY